MVKNFGVIKLMVGCNAYVGRIQHPSQAGSMHSWVPRILRTPLVHPPVFWLTQNMLSQAICSPTTPASPELRMEPSFPPRRLLIHETVTSGGSSAAALI